MAINNIPGVGPANSDIAAAVAAPSAATIAAAVAAPSAATIAAAVAAPSAASIVSAGNAAGWGATGGGAITWTDLGSQAPGTNINTVTFSGISSSYKYLKVLFIFTTSTATNGAFYARLNNDTSSSYPQGGIMSMPAQANAFKATNLTRGGAIDPSQTISNNSWTFGELNIQNANSSAPKICNFMFVGSNSTYTGTFLVDQKAFYTGTSAINRLDFVVGSTNFAGGSTNFYLLGGN